MADDAGDLTAEEIAEVKEALKLSNEELELALQSFNFFDSDGDGKISPADIKAFLKALCGDDADDAEDEATIKMIREVTKREGGDDNISFMEYTKHWHKKQTVEMTEVFNLIDTDSDGKITKIDIEKFVKTWGGAYAVMVCASESQSMSEIASEVIGSGGGDPNGQIDLNDFQRIMAQAESRASRASRASRMSRRSRGSRSSLHD